MTPPELLHVSGSGLILYMFTTLAGGMSDKDRSSIDELHQDVTLESLWQSEKDFPIGSVRNGIIDGTKCQSTERRGNLFRLACIAETTSGSAALKSVWEQFDVTQTQFCNFIYLYLVMEEWMHDFNQKEKVRSADRLVASILRKLKKVFPRTEGNEWNLPKFHGMVKMLHFIQLFGSGINFYGGPAESHHKYFVKNPGQLTQRRVTEFAKQVANRVYEGMVFEIANEHVNREDNMWRLIGSEKEESEIAEELTFSGEYDLTLLAPEPGSKTGKESVKWRSKNKKRRPVRNTNFIRII